MPETEHLVRFHNRGQVIHIHSGVFQIVIHRMYTGVEGTFCTLFCV